MQGFSKETDISNKSNTMFRRTNGRSPPLLLGCLFLCIIILSYSYWSLNMQNNDTLRNLENLQASLKIGEVKREQNEQKMSALQDSLHEKEEAINQHKSKLTQQEMDLQTYNNDLKKKDYEITSLKENIQKLEEKLMISDDKLMEAMGDIERLTKENDQVISQKDDAESALAKRDQQIITLERKLEQENIRNAQLDANMKEMTKLLTSNKRQFESLQQQQAMASAAAAPQGMLPAKSESLNDAHQPREADGVAPKPLSNGGGEDNAAERMSENQQQGVLQEPLKPHEVPVVGNNLQSDHLQAPPVGAAGDAGRDVMQMPPDFDSRNVGNKSASFFLGGMNLEDMFSKHDDSDEENVIENPNDPEDEVTSPFDTVAPKGRNDDVIVVESLNSTDDTINFNQSPDENLKNSTNSNDKSGRGLLNLFSFFNRKEQEPEDENFENVESNREKDPSMIQKVI